MVSLFSLEICFVENLSTVNLCLSVVGSALEMSTQLPAVQRAPSKPGFLPVPVHPKRRVSCTVTAADMKMERFVNVSSMS